METESGLVSSLIGLELIDLVDNHSKTGPILLIFRLGGWWTGGLISGHFTCLMRLPFGLIRGGGISWRLPFGLRRVVLKLHDGTCRINSASSHGGLLAITELKVDSCAACSCLVGDGRVTSSMLDCESVSKVEDERRLSPERGEADSHQLDSSSLIDAGEGGYCSPMDVSEFDSVA